jgi:hypothetical protein
MVCEARQIARDYGCFVVEKSGAQGLTWILYRVNPDPDKKPIFLGRYVSPATLRLAAEKICIDQKPRRRTA